MTEKPLLIFPTFNKAPREKRPKPTTAPNFHLPGFQQQRDRFIPQFESMMNCFITDTADGIEPEYVLVLETVGKIEDFERAVRAIKGLEWLAEIDTDDIEPDNDYYRKAKIKKDFFVERIDGINNAQSSKIFDAFIENKLIDTDGYLLAEQVQNFESHIPQEFLEYKDKIVKCLMDSVSESEKRKISGRLFLSMSNRQAVEQLLNLWKSWDKQEKKFKRGTTKWRDIFLHLKTLRRWDIEDRFKDTGIENFWQEELEIKKGTASKIIFEIELWYQENESKRAQSHAIIEQLILQENGEIITSCIINEIRFHAIKAALPPNSIEKILNHRDTKLLSNNYIMFFRPSGQCRVESYPEGDIADFQVGSVSGLPVVALLDGYPLANHALLENRLIIDDPDDFESSYRLEERKHGTAMASLICHGELDADEPPLNRPIYVRPIMKPDEIGYNSPRNEIIPDSIFLEDIIERSVRKIFEGDGDGIPAASTVKIINLSIGDPSKMFFNRLSSAARLLDWLSFKYNVLFCVSAGNIDKEINIDKAENDMKALSQDEILKSTMSEIDKDIRNRRILAPADSINSITIGALHADRSEFNDPGKRIDILPSQLLPSPISAIGNGFRNSIKPEIYLPGGRQLYDWTQDNKYKISQSKFAPGQKVATTPVMPGENNRCVYTRGTSNAAALATRCSAQIYEVLDEIREQYVDKIPETNISVLIKTLLVHSASWGESEDVMGKCLKGQKELYKIKKTISRYLGFGTPEISRVLECTSQRATVIGSGVIEKDERHDFRLPFPPSLSGSREKRRLIITLAWFSPINPRTRKYRKANLSFDPPKAKSDLGFKRKESEWQQVKNGTIQHEILEGNEIVPYEEGRELLIPVIYREDAGAADEKIPYGLAVTLEVAENINIPIYEEIKERIRIPIKIKE